MAKKSKKRKTGDLNVDAIISKYGDVVSTGSELLDRLKKFKVIGISPALDLGLGGGIREGSCVAMTGDPKTGKTTTALYFAAKCQKEGKKVYYHATEGRVDKHNLEQIEGLNIDDLIIIQSTDDAILSAEKHLNMMEETIKTVKDVVIICDSTSSMVPQDELDGEIRTGVRNALPRLLAMFFKRIANDVQRTGAICVFITHNIANTGGSRFAPAKMADCGNMLQYQVSTNMIITHRQKWEDSTNKWIGQIVNWKIMTSSAGGTPNTLVTSYLKYGVGLDEAREIAELGIQLCLINQGGAWYTLTTLVNNATHPTISAWLDGRDPEKAFKLQGLNNLSDFLRDNPTLREFIYQEIRDMLV